MVHTRSLGGVNLGLDVAIPDTSLIDCSDLRQKTVKVGSLGRAFAVFRVERVYIYKTNHLPQNRKQDIDLLFQLLSYMDTPQYLRRQVFPHTPSLKFVGLLPPLRTRSHPLEAAVEKLEVGDIRWGIKVRTGSVDIGVKQLITYSGSLSEREPTLFRIISTNPEIVLESIQREDVDDYWGFDITHTKNLVQLLRNSANKTRVAFSRIAPVYNKIENELVNTITSTKSVCVVFGGPRKGLRELLADEMESLKENMDFWVNSVLGQGTETVRLEEALWASLTLLNNSVGAIITKPGYH